MKRGLIIFLIVIGIAVLFQGFLYRQVIGYRSVGIRHGKLQASKVLQHYIDSFVDGKAIYSINDVVDIALSATVKKLNYAASGVSNEPDQLVHSRKAHCVGYANFLAATCNYLLVKSGMNRNWVVQRRVGNLYFLGFNVHHLFSSPFFKDHDFVTIENKQTGDVIAVDPTISDYSYISRVCFSK